MILYSTTKSVFWSTGNRYLSKKLSSAKRSLESH